MFRSAIRRRALAGPGRVGVLGLACLLLAAGARATGQAPAASPRRPAGAGGQPADLPPRCELRPGGRLSHAQRRTGARPRAHRLRAARGRRASGDHAVRADLAADHHRHHLASRSEHGGRVARAGGGSAPARVRDLPRHRDDDRRGFPRRAKADRGDARSPDRSGRSVRGDDARHGRQRDHLRAPDREPRHRAGQVLDLGPARHHQPPRSGRGRARDLLPGPGAGEDLLRPQRRAGRRSRPTPTAVSRRS